MNEFHYIFMISDIVIKLSSDCEFSISENFLAFCTESRPDYTIFYREIPELPEIPEVLLHKSANFVVASDRQGGYARFFRSKAWSSSFFAVGRYDLRNHRSTIEYVPDGKRYLTGTRNCFFYVALETILLNEQRMILHAACVETSIGGLLFSGPSGIGKSTQADLWCKYDGASLLNGDRTILHCREDGWYGYGSPYAGSSKCYVNNRCRVRAIIMLRQASECTVRLLSASEAFKKIYSGLTVNSWNPDYVASICDLTAQLVAEIPVYELACTADETAVNILKNTLAKGGIG